MIFTAGQRLIQQIPQIRDLNRSDRVSPQLKVRQSDLKKIGRKTTLRDLNFAVNVLIFFHYFSN